MSRITHDRGKTRRLFAWLVLIGVGVFVVDLQLPLGVATGMLYALLPLVGLWYRSRPAVLLSAIVGTILTLIGAWLSEPGGVGWMVATNRALSLLVVWALALVLLRYLRVRRALREAREGAQSYLDIAEVMILVLDRDGRVERINRKGCEVLGCTSEEAVGQVWLETFVPERLRPEIRASFECAVRGDPSRFAHVESEVLRNDGHERLIAWHNKLVRDESGRIVGTLGSGQDVTDVRRAEEERLSVVQQLEDVKFALDQAAIVATTDRGGRITYVNDLFCLISKYPREELLGQDHRLVNSGFHSKGFFRDLWRTIGAGEIWRGEIRNRSKDGRSYWVDTTIVPFLDERGKPYQYMAIRSDITERKTAEDALRHQESLARIGRMAAQVAHEVKNPLAGISGALQIIRGRLPEASPDRDIVGEMLQRIDALNQWIQELLVFARPRPPDLAPVELRAILDETLGLAGADPAFAKTSLSLTGDDLTIAADGDLLRSLFFNLLLNAAQAQENGGKIRVNVQTRDRNALVSVRDDGPGIPEDARARIFEPFFTTRHRGTGLGLAVARQIVEGHHGEIEIVCPAAGGTVVTVTLPIETEPS